MQSCKIKKGCNSNLIDYNAIAQNKKKEVTPIQTRRFLWEFPIGSYVRLSSAVVAILVGVLKCWTHFGRGPPKNHFSKVWLRLAQ